MESDCKLDFFFFLMFNFFGSVQGFLILILLCVVVVFILIVIAHNLSVLLMDMWVVSFLHEHLYTFFTNISIYRFILRYETFGIASMNIFSYKRYCQRTFQRSYTNLHSHQQDLRVCYSPSGHTWYICHFHVSPSGGL